MPRSHKPAAADRAIATMELFKGLTRRQRRRVAALSTILHRPAGCVVAREGEFAQELLVLVSGRALSTVAGVRAVVMPAGSHVGTTGLVGPVRHTATVTTVTPTDILVFGAADIRDLVAAHPILRFRLDAADPPEDTLDAAGLEVAFGRPRVSLDQ